MVRSTLPPIYEMYLDFAAALRRGYNLLLLDGPGQGRSLIEQGLVMRPDWENVVGSVVDYALTRPEVDLKRIALMGWSFGGYLAPRAASAEHRLAACVADPRLVRSARSGEGALLSPPERRAGHVPGRRPGGVRASWSTSRRPQRFAGIVQRAFWVHVIDSLPK